MEGIVDTCFEEGNTQIVRTILTVTAELTILPVAGQAQLRAEA